jgi:hypothetical protein
MGPFDFEVRELRRQGRKALVFTFCPAVFDDDIPAFDIAELTQPRDQRLRSLGITGGEAGFQQADSSELRPCLL